MQPYFLAIAIAIILTVTGCSGFHVKKYEGPDKSPQELAFVFTNHMEGSWSRIISIDGEDHNPWWPGILELKPGIHNFGVRNGPMPPDRRYSSYSVTAELKAGFTYVPVGETRGILDAPAIRVCLAEEPHEPTTLITGPRPDLHTARVNISGDFRYPSLDAPLVGCSGVEPLPLQVNEKVIKYHPPGTLLVGEIIGPLTRMQILARYSKDDLAAAGWSAENVVDGAAVMLSNFSQKQAAGDSVHVLYALVRKEGPAVTGSRGTCNAWGGCTYGGDVVTLRVLATPTRDAPSGTNLVESLVEAENVEGDCFYADLGTSKPPAYRFALFCKSLGAAGWTWAGDEYAKVPGAIP